MPSCEPIRREAVVNGMGSEVCQRCRLTCYTTITEGRSVESR